MTQMTQTQSQEPAMPRRAVQILIAAVLAVLATTAPAAAQSGKLQIEGYGIAGSITFASNESFDAVFGKHSGLLLGGGGKVGLPWFGLFVDLGAWQFEDTGERVVRVGGTIYKLGIPVTFKVTPFELTGGWQYQGRRGIFRRFTPYLGAGFSSYAYEETSSFAETTENSHQRFSGYHLLGGGEVKLFKWLGVAGEAAWTSVPNALGADGISKQFGETDLGGTSFRMKVLIGR